MSCSMHRKMQLKIELGEGKVWRLRFLTFTQKILFWNKNIFFLATIWESKKKIAWWSFQIDEQMATWFFTERYCIQSINGNAKCRDIFTAFKRYLFLEKSSMIDCVLNAPMKCITLTHSFPMHYFSTPWKHQKILLFSGVSGGRERVHWERMG